jgi:hypothetical protein
MYSSVDKQVFSLFIFISQWLKQRGWLALHDQDMPAGTGRHDISWYPIQWAIEVIRQAKVDGEIIDHRYAR